MQDVYVGVAYVDFQQEREINKERHADKKYNNDSSVGSRLYELLTKLYLGTQRYVHCELFFPSEDEDKDTHVLAFGVFSDQGVFSKKREFTNPAYRQLFLQISVQEYLKLLNFCIKQVGKPFDETGMRWSPIWPTKCDQKSWYCLSFVVAALNTIGILKNYHPTSLDTDEVVELLHMHPRKCESILRSKMLSKDNKNISIVTKQSKHK